MKSAFDTHTLLIIGRDEGISDPLYLEGIEVVAWSSLFGGYSLRNVSMDCRIGLSTATPFE